MSAPAPRSSSQRPDASPPTGEAYLEDTDKKGRLKSTWERVQAYRAQHATAEMALFFSAGFLFDVFTLSRIDDAVTLIQQGVYLLLLAISLGLETRQSLKGDLPRWLARGLEFSEDAIHFLFGSLLSSFALFYFKSASGLTALAFVVILFGLLVANELPRFRKLGPVVRYAIFSFSLTSYFAYLFPVLLGFLSTWLFVLACAVSAAVLYGVYWLLSRWGISRGHVLKRAILPAGLVQAVLVGLYVLKAIPPVPLAVQYLGVYHGLERVGPRIHALHERPWWRFWQNGDQTYVAQPGDRLHVFANLFAPSGFKDRIFVRWSRYDERRGWIESDAIPVVVEGSRKEGYRSRTTKANYEPGLHRAQIETEDGRTIGSIRFTVEPAQPGPDGTFPSRVFQVDTF